MIAKLLNLSFETVMKGLVIALLVCLFYIGYLIGQEYNIIPKDMHCYKPGKLGGQGKYIPVDDCLFNQKEGLWNCSDGKFLYCHDPKKCNTTLQKDKK